MTKLKLYYEHVTERIGHAVLASSVTIATPEQINDAAQRHAEGRCPHTIVYDVDGGLYDVRICGTCGQGLGTV